MSSFLLSLKTFVELEPRRGQRVLLMTDDGINLYLRNTFMLVNSNVVPCVVIANISIPDQKRRQGIGSSLVTTIHTYNKIILLWLNA